MNHIYGAKTDRIYQQINQIFDSFIYITGKKQQTQGQ